MKPTTTWREMLDESLKNPHFCQEWEDANAELAELDCIVAGRFESGLPQADSLGSTASQTRSVHSRQTVSTTSTITRTASGLNSPSSSE